jgi:hypothetical protein
MRSTGVYLYGTLSGLPILTNTFLYSTHIRTATTAAPPTPAPTKAIGNPEELFEVAAAAQKIPSYLKHEQILIV